MRDNFHARAQIAARAFFLPLFSRPPSRAMEPHAAARRDLEHQFRTAEGRPGRPVRRRTGPGRPVPAGDQVPRGRVPAPGLHRHGPAAPGDQRPEGLARRGHRLAPADRGRAALDVCREGHARGRLGVVVEGVEIQNFYVPAGGDVPDRAENPKFDHKLDFFERLTADWSPRATRRRRWLIAGDLNVAPGEIRRLEPPLHVQVVSHTPVEVEAMAAAAGAAGAFIDLVREARPSRKSWPPGGATAPPTSAPRTVACGSTTSGSRRA